MEDDVKFKDNGALDGTYGESLTIPLRDERHVLWASQRDNRGYDDTELWSLDMTFARFILPRLYAYRSAKKGRPSMMSSNTEWYMTLTAMIKSFEFYADDEHPLTAPSPSIDAGLKLFAQWYGYLWF